MWLCEKTIAVGGGEATMNGGDLNAGAGARWTRAKNAQITVH